MTEEKNVLVERAEAALSSLPLPEPDWDAFASRIASAVGAAPAEDTTLFDAPLPATDDDGETPVTAPVEVSVPAPGDIATPVAVAGAAEDAGPTLSVAPASSDEVDDAWSSAPEATELAPPAGSWIDASVEASSAAVAAAEPEDLTAHASNDDSAPVASAEPAESRREPVSLADLARASIARRGSAEKASIAKESLAVASQSRAQGDAITQRLQPAASYPPPASPSVAPPPPSARRAAETRRGDVLKGPWPGVVIAAVGLAAGFALYLRRPESPVPIAIVQPAPEAPVAPRAETPREPTADRKREATAEPAGEAALDPSSLPALRRGATHTEAKSAATDAKGSGVVAKAPVAPAPPSTASTGKVAAEKIVLEEEQKAAPKAAPSSTARPGDSKLRPAELSGSTMTERPSAGAAQAAVGAVLGAARACVAGHPQPSSAQLVFGSDGQVASVTVGGPAAGTPSAACIESALRKARVQPFAAPSFSLGVTVRPL